MFTTNQHRLEFLKVLTKFTEQTHNFLSFNDWQNVSRTFYFLFPLKKFKKV